MSEYKTIEIEISDSECIIKALEEMGYKPIVCLDSPRHLEGYHGDIRSQKAHIIVPRSQIGSASNDVGFELIDGKYIAHVSAYDKHTWAAKLNRLRQGYAKQKIKKAIKKKSSRYSLKSESVDEKGNIRLKVKIRG